MVTYLYLDNEMDNFHGQQNLESGTFSWDMSNLELPTDGSVALSSINVSFVRNVSRVKISSNLIQPNYFNPDGILISFPPTRTREISSFFCSPQYWKIDIANPRVITLEFHNVNISNIRFAAFTLAIC